MFNDMEEISVASSWNRMSSLVARGRWIGREVREAGGAAYCADVRTSAFILRWGTMKGLSRATQDFTQYFNRITVAALRKQGQKENE